MMRTGSDDDDEANRQAPVGDERVAYEEAVLNQVTQVCVLVDALQEKLVGVQEALAFSEWDHIQRAHNIEIRSDSRKPYTVVELSAAAKAIERYRAALLEIDRAFDLIVTKCDRSR